MVSLKVSFETCSDFRPLPPTAHFPQATAQLRNCSRLLEFRLMGIAIRKDAAQTTLNKLVDKYTEEGRTCLKMTCPTSKCGQEYTVYYGPALCGVEAILNCAQHEAAELNARTTRAAHSLLDRL